jgi:hypothetical protein
MARPRDAEKLAALLKEQLWLAEQVLESLQRETPDDHVGIDIFRDAISTTKLIQRIEGVKANRREFGRARSCGQRRRPSPRRRRSHAARRAAGVRSGNDPGDDGPGEPPPRPRLVPPPPARYTFGFVAIDSSGEYETCPKCGHVLLVRWDGTLYCPRIGCEA